MPRQPHCLPVGAGRAGCRRADAAVKLGHCLSERRQGVRRSPIAVDMGNSSAAVPHRWASLAIAQVLLLIQIDSETWIEERVLIDATFGVAPCIADDARASHPVVEAIVRVSVQPQVRLPILKSSP